MKVKVYTNKLPFSLTEELSKVSEFFKPYITITFEVKSSMLPTTIVSYKTVQGFSPTNGKPMLLKYYGLDESIKKNFIDVDTDIVMFAWNIDTIPSPTDGVITSWTNNVPISMKTDFIQLALNQYIKNTGTIVNRMTHEILHALCFKANRLGIPTLDEMDMTADGKAYYKNDTPDAPDGNYSRTLKNLQPYFKGLTSPVVTSSMPTCTIIRKHTKKEATGILIAQNGQATFGCKTVERPWLNNTNSISCIPAGTYTVKWTLSPKFMRYTYQVMNVPNRSGIRIHSANYYSQLEGCIALGDALVDINKDGELDTINSKKTIALFEKFMEKKTFQLTIK